MLTKEETKRLSKFLSYVLRHNPAHLDIVLDDQGWTNVDVLISRLSQRQVNISIDILKHIVETNNKKRFSFNEDFTCIRASQGHSVAIALNYSAQQPPVILYHGTAGENLEAIRENGILKMSRHHVHLSADRETAYQVGQRHGRPVVLSIRALAMHDKGHLFYISDNAVWLTAHVPVEYLDMEA